MEMANSAATWRWRSALTVLLLLLGLLGTGASLAILPRTYQSNASVILLASPELAKQTGGNPYLSFSSSLALAADAVNRRVTDPETTRTLAGHGDTGSYTVTMPSYGTSLSGSVLLITVTGSEPATVDRTMSGVISAVRASLAGLQSGIHLRERIQLAVLAPATRAALATSHTVRSVIVIAILMLTAALGIPWLIEARLSRKAHLRVSRYPEPGDEWPSADLGLTADDATLASVPHGHRS
jgi:hypothetical protein